MDHKTVNGNTVITDAVSAFHDPTVNAAHVIGDWHGDLRWAEKVIYREIDTESSNILLHVGDFGIWHGDKGRSYINAVSKALLQRGLFMYVTLGNHEDFDLIDTMEDVDGMPGCKYADKNDRIVLLARPYTWEWSGKKIMSFGGANSVDKWSRVEGKSWWGQEQITDEQVYHANQVGKVDIMVTHDVPTQVDPFDGKPGPMRLATYQVIYADQSREQLQRVFNTARPELFFHGHYHKNRARLEHLTDYTMDRTEEQDNRYSVRTIGLSMNGMNGNHGLFRIGDPMTFHDYHPKPRSQ